MVLLILIAFEARRRGSGMKKCGCHSYRAHGLVTLRIQDGISGCLADKEHFAPPFSL